MGHDVVIDTIIGVIDPVWRRVIGGLGWILIIIEGQLSI
jgi:hypothetical protein